MGRHLVVRAVVAAIPALPGGQGGLDEEPSRTIERDAAVAALVVGAWIGANFMALVNSAAIFRGEEADVRTTADVIALARLSLMFAAVVLAFFIVKRITALQEERYRSLAGSG